MERITTVDQAWEYLTEYGTATEEELQLVTCINGYSFEVMEQVLDVRTGYKSFDQLMDLDDEDSEDDSEE